VQCLQANWSTMVDFWGSNPFPHIQNLMKTIFVHN
jgi:hypothetical protein